MSLPEAGSTLKQFGITTREQERLQVLSPYEAQQELSQNLEAYTNEVLADKPVSIPYRYWFDTDDHVYSSPSLKPIYRVDQQFDPQERGGLPGQGFEKVSNLLVHNPGKLVFWYSPQGPASFDKNPQNPFSQITYDYGQLYIQYFNKDKVNAVAVKVGNEEVLETLVPELSTLRSGYAEGNERERITSFLLNPVLSDGTIDDFLDRNFENALVYEDKEGKKYGIDDVLAEIRDAFANVKKPKPMSLDKTVAALTKQEVTKEFVLKVYISAINAYMQKTGRQTMQLSGSCGGGKVTSGMIEGILQTGTIPSITEMLSIYSPQFRTATQEKKWEYHDGTCCICGHKDTKVGPCSICQDCEKTLD